MLLLHPLFNGSPVVEFDGAVVGGVGDEIERDAEFGVEGGGHVFWEVFGIGGDAPFAVGAADDGATGDAGAGHDREAGGCPVVAAAGGVDLGGAAEIGEP